MKRADMHYFSPLSVITGFRLCVFRRYRLRSLAIAALIILSASQCQSQFRPPQVEVGEQDTVNYDFFQQGKNEIENRDYLEPFFKKLYRQRTSGGQRINIIHIGDSHILGNMLTHEVRRRLQREFGDAGRGLVFPYKLANTNGPKDFLVETDARWYGSNCQRDLDEATPFGVSGFILETFNPDGQLTFRLRDTSTSEIRQFTKVTIFHRRDDDAFDFQVNDEATKQEAVLYLQDAFFKSYYFDRPVSQVHISFKRQKPGEKASLMLDGIVLENELSGVVYHSIGVNGGKFSDFARARFFARQLADLNPDLVVLSFGTNEAQGRSNLHYLRQQMENLVNQIQMYAPNTYFLLTTPADSYLKGRGFNPYMSQVSATIRQFAEEKHFALWDLFGLAGGEKSAASWKSSGLMASDSVHYSKWGYAVQGKLFYQSVAHAYNDFVQQHAEE